MCSLFIGLQWFSWAFLSSGQNNVYVMSSGCFTGIFSTRPLVFQSFFFFLHQSFVVLEPVREHIWEHSYVHSHSLYGAVSHPSLSESICSLSAKEQASTQSASAHHSVWYAGTQWHLKSPNQPQAAKTLVNDLLLCFKQVPCGHGCFNIF